jgi:phage tail-like protein
MPDYHKKYSFRVEIDGISVASFKKAGPLKSTQEVIEENEGGSLSPQKDPGKIKYEDITLERGVTDNEELWSWYKTFIDGNGEKKDLAIVQTDRAGTEIRRWEIFEAFPTEFQAGDWDADASENTVEMMTLSIDSFKLA